MLCQQAAAVGLTQEALLRHLVSAAAVRGGGEPLPPLPEVVAAAAEAEAEAAAAEKEAVADEAAEAEGEGAAWGRGWRKGWGAFADLAELDQEGVEALVASRAAGDDLGEDSEAEFPAVAWQEFSSWRPVDEQAAAAAALVGEEAAAAAEGGGEFEFIDATGDPSLDPVAQAQQQQWAEEDAAVGGLPYAYDELRSGDFYEGVAANVHLADPADLATAGDEAGLHLEHMHPTKQRVWVLLGGDGPGRTQSLAAGLHAYLRWVRLAGRPSVWWCGSAWRAAVLSLGGTACVSPHIYSPQLRPSPHLCPPPPHAAAACASTRSCWWRLTCWSPTLQAAGECASTCLAGWLAG